MVRAIWNGTVIAQSDDTIVVEGNHYFPRNAVNAEFLEMSTTHTWCSWKGRASYYSIVVKGERNVDGAWYYPETGAAANEVRDRIAFWRGVRIVK